MLKRSILLFPEFTDPIIHEIRSQHDPLATKIGPHLTLVFPFESLLSNQDVISHMKQTLAETAPFEVVFSGVTGDWPSGYVFLNVKQGNDFLFALHDKLYQGILRDYLWREVHYLPHVTLAQTGDYQVFQEILEKTKNWHQSYKVKVKTILLESIDEEEQSLIEYRYQLKETEESESFHDLRLL